MAEPLIHFWCPDALAAGVESWDPDAEPRRYASGVGHVLLELYARLLGAGARVELGESATRRPALVLVAAGLVRKHRSNLEASLRAVARARGRVILVRSDIPLAWRFPLEPTVELMPYRALAIAPYQRWLPPLPQRGLRPRPAGSIERIETVTIKCNPATLPDELRDETIAAALEAQGVRLWIDMPQQTDGSDQTWHDFSTVEAALCARSSMVGEAWITSKPATKLINAWAAGCIPLATREAAYVELGREGEDVCFVDDVNELPRVVAELNGDRAALSRLQRGSRRRQAEFAPAAVLTLWRNLLEDAAATAPPSRARTVRAVAAALTVGASRRAEHVRLAVRLRLGR